MKTIIYLAGGMNSSWQDSFIENLPDIEFVDPRKHGLTTEAEYTAWDLAGIRRSSLVVAFMDSENPSGFGLSLEVGYAHALGLPVWYVCEDTTPRQRFFGMVRACASRQFSTAGDCIQALKTAAPSPVVQAPAQAGEVARLVEEAKLRADSYYSTGSFRNGESMAVIEREKLHAAVDRLAALATQPLAAPVQQGAEAEFTCATLSKAIGCKALSLMQLLQPAPTLNQRLSVNDVATIMAHLYATPTAQPVLAPVVREPLSIKQILLIADEADLARDYNDDGDVQSTRREDADITEDVVHFARAIERHFGIQATTGEQSHG